MAALYFLVFETEHYFCISKYLITKVRISDSLITIVV